IGYVVHPLDRNTANANVSDAARDARERLRERLDGWRREHGQTRLPIDVIALASARGVRVEAEADEPLVRRRFAVAHDLVRTLLNDDELCDWGASVLLMPDELTWSYRTDQGLRAVERLARDAKVSLEAAGLRLVERSGTPAAFVVADAVGRDLSVRYARVRDLRVLIPRGAAVAPASSLARAARSGRRERAVEPLPGDSQQEFHVEAKSYPTGRGTGARERVLALAWPAQHAR
ncbi:MAG TPA: hypothetical protein VFS37_14120, partial [Conexibacter sp.]|nr:hypothetical protein [Conexibacter sp.]